MRTTTFSLLLALALVPACAKPAATPAPEMPPPAPAIAAQPVAQPAAPAPRAQPAHPDPVVARLIELGRTESQVDALLRELVDNFGPRLTGSHNLMAAEKWARDKLASFGLEARLEKWGELPVGFDRGPASGFMTAPERVELDFVTPSWTPGILGPVEGPAIVYPASVKQARALAGRAKNAWLLHTAASAKLPDKTRKAIDAALKQSGVAGHIHRSRDPEGQLVHTSGRYRISWKELPDRVRIQLRGDQFDDIAKRLAGGAEVSLAFSIDNRFFNGPVPQYNVVADLVGSEKPDEYIIIGGHLDSWDGALGVVDNATGVATTLEAARLLSEAGVRPKRTIRFMLWSGEEQGLLGSRAYVDAHPELMEKVSLVLVHDGGTNYLSGLSVTPEMASQAETALEPLFGLNPEMPFGLYYATQLQPGGSDHNSFIKAGVPGFFWHQHGLAEYRRAHHTQYDTYEALRPDYQQHSALVVTLAALGFANLDGLLDRTDSAPLGASRRLGVELDGTKINEVVPKSNAAKLGLRAGDVLVEMNGVQLSSVRDIVVQLRAKGDKRTIVYRRGKKTRKVVLDFSTHPDEERKKQRAARRKAKYGELDMDKPFVGTAPPDEHDPRWRQRQREQAEAAKAKAAEAGKDNPDPAQNQAN